MANALPCTRHTCAGTDNVVLSAAWGLIVILHMDMKSGDCVKCSIGWLHLLAPNADYCQWDESMYKTHAHDRRRMYGLARCQDPQARPMKDAFRLNVGGLLW